MLNVIFQNIFVATLISMVLAIIIVIAEKYLSNYGDCKITINGKKDLTVKGGGNLLTTLAANKIFIPSACGGRGSCGYCKVKAQSGAGPLLPTEKPYLTPTELKDNTRLACQIKVRNDLEINIPESLFNIRRVEAIVKKIEDYTYDTKGVTFQLPEGQGVDFIAGQYMQLESPKYGKVKQSVSRAYSISSNPINKNELQLIIRQVPEGICTTYVHKHLKEGDKANLTGPFGSFTLKDTGNDIFFIAGGSGKAPIKSMVEYIKTAGINRRIVYFFGARTMADLYLTDYFFDFEKTLPDFTYVPILSQPDKFCKSDWCGKSGYINDYLKEYLRDPSKTEAYLCGSPGMITSIEKSLLQLGIPKSNIDYDSFA